MSDYPVHTLQSAPAASQETLAKLKEGWGFLPNLGAVIAESPAALELLANAYGALMSKSELTAAEQQIISVAASRENRCEYCVSAHSTMALSAQVPADLLTNLREGRPLKDAKLEALRVVTIKMVTERGYLSEEDRRRFFAAGYTPGQLLEVVGWVAIKTLTNYTNHIANTPIDPQWQGQLWKAR
jgi:uncharacterized peroxidase-related enzyme